MTAYLKSSFNSQLIFHTNWKFNHKKGKKKEKKNVKVSSQSENQTPPLVSSSLLDETWWNFSAWKMQKRRAERKLQLQWLIN